MKKKHRPVSPEGSAAKPSAPAGFGGWWKATGGSRPWRRLAGLGVMVAGLGLLGGWLWSRHRQAAAFPTTTPGLPPLPGSVAGSGEKALGAGAVAESARDGMLRPKEDQLVATLNQGNKLLEQGKIGEAIAHYRRVVEMDPDSEDGHFDLGIALAKQGQIQEAIQQYREALRLMPDYAEAHNNLGNLLVNQKQYAEAIEHFNTTLRLQPRHAAAHNNLGRVLAIQGKYPEAIERFRQALQLKPDYAEAHYNLGLAYLGQHRFADAVAQYAEAVRLRPDYEPAAKALAQAREKQAQQLTNH